MCAFCEHDAKTVGKFFGYHQCCIDAFVEHAEKYGSGDTEHLTHYQTKYQRLTKGKTAFMPCSKHAKQLVKKQIGPSDMTVNRICSLPFPYIDELSVNEFAEWIADN